MPDEFIDPAMLDSAIAQCDASGHERVFVWADSLAKVLREVKQLRYEKTVREADEVAEIV